MAHVTARQTLSRRAFVRRLGGTALVSALGAQLWPLAAVPRRHRRLLPSRQPWLRRARRRWSNRRRPRWSVAVAASRCRRSWPPTRRRRTCRRHDHTAWLHEVSGQAVRSVADPPAKGGEINIITQTLGTVPPTPMDSNPVWQEINKRVGATLKISITPVRRLWRQAADDPRRQRPAGPAVPAARPAGPGLSQFLEAKVRRPDAVPERRRHQGLPQPGRAPDRRVEDHRHQQQDLRRGRSDPALLLGALAPPGIARAGQPRGAQERRRLQAASCRR